MQLSIEVEKVSGISRKLSVRVPAEIVSKRIEGAYVELQKTVALKGFRPGNAPITMIKQYYKDDVQHRVFHTLIDETYEQAIRENKLKTVGRPKIETPQHKTGADEHAHTIETGQELVYTAQVDILPEVELKDYTGIPLKENSVDLTDKDIETVISAIADSQAQLIPVTGGLVGADGKPMGGREARKGDFVDVDFDGGLVTDSGVEKQAGMKGSRTLEIGSGSLIEGFEEQIIGMKSGENKTFRISFPKDYHAADLANKEAEFSVVVNSLKEKKMPEIDEEFAKGMGYENLSDMKKKAEEHLRRERTREVENSMKSELIEALIAKHKFEVPVALVQEQTRTLANSFASNLKQQGLTDAMIGEAITTQMEELKKRAEDQVKASLILDAIADQEQVSVSSREIDDEIEEMAVSMQTDEAKVREFYEKNPQRRADLEYRIREDKTVKLLIEKAKVRKVKP